DPGRDDGRAGRPNVASLRLVGGGLWRLLAGLRRSVAAAYHPAADVFLAAVRPDVRRPGRRTGTTLAVRSAADPDGPVGEPSGRLPARPRVGRLLLAGFSGSRLSERQRFCSLERSGRASVGPGGGGTGSLEHSLWLESLPVRGPDLDRRSESGH